MANLLPLARAVDGGRLIQFLIEAGQRSQIDDGVVARILPHVAEHEDEGPVLGLGVEVDSGHAQRGEDLVENALCGHERVDQVRNDDPGDEVGQEQDGVVHLGRNAVVQLVDDDGQAHGHHQAQRHEHQVVTNRVAHNRPCVRRLEDELEVVQGHPRVVDKQAVDELVLDPEILRGFCQGVTLESKDDCGHWQVAEAEKERQAGKKHRQKSDMTLYFTGSPLIMFQCLCRAGRQCGFCSHCVSSCS